MSTQVPRRVGLFVGMVQLFFALTWTVYVAYLPQLAAQVGLPKSAVIQLLMLDQLVFVLADYACGVASDRMARLHGRIGPAVLAMTVASACAFVLLPVVAPMATAPVFIGLTVVWAIGSSALRAPPMNLIGRYAPKPRQPALLAMSMLGLGLASAVAPYLGAALRDIDPRVPFLLSAVALSLATLGIVAAERALQAGRSGHADARAVDAKAHADADADADACATATAQATIAPAPPTPPGLGGAPWGPWLAAAALATLAFQLHVFFNSGGLYLKHGGAANLQHLAPVFWVGFNLALWPASLATRRWGALKVMGTAGLVAGCGSALAVASGGLAMLVAAQALAGAAWAGVLMAAFAAALAFGHTGREGQVSGALSSTLALAALLRMAATAVGAAQWPADDSARVALLWAPSVLWLLVGAALLEGARRWGRPVAPPAQAITRPP